MTRTILLGGAALLVLSACNAREEGNKTVISVDREQVEQTVDQGVDQAGNALGAAAGEVKEAADKAGPALENAAEKTGAAVERAGNRIENTDIDVDVKTRNEQNR